MMQKTMFLGCKHHRASERTTYCWMGSSSASEADLYPRRTSLSHLKSAALLFQQPVFGHTPEHLWSLVPSQAARRPTLGGPACPMRPVKSVILAVRQFIRGPDAGTRPVALHATIWLPLAVNESALGEFLRASPFDAAPLPIVIRSVRATIHPQPLGPRLWIKATVCVRGLTLN